MEFDERFVGLKNHYWAWGVMMRGRWFALIVWGVVCGGFGCAHIGSLRPAQSDATGRQTGRMNGESADAGQDDSAEVLAEATTPTENEPSALEMIPKDVETGADWVGGIIDQAIRDNKFPAPVADEGLATFDIPVTVNEKVTYFIRFFQGRGRTFFKKWLERSTAYVPMMHRILEDQGLPKDLVYLSLIESGFSPRAYSRSRASGLWQFIQSTGERYDLKTEWWIDERRDPVKATIAAARHLNDLYAHFNDWYLAWAAYNAGQRKIDQAIERYGTRDFWKLTKNRNYLRLETRNYVPKLIAAALIAKNPKAYGFSDLSYERPSATEEVVVTKGVDLSALAKAMEIDSGLLRGFNPELRHGMVPKSIERYVVRVPLGTVDLALAKIDQLPEVKQVSLRRHRIRRGETLSDVALRYGVGVTILQRANNITNARRLRVGQTILIPSTSRDVPELEARVAPKRSRPVAAVAPTPAKAVRTAAVVPAGAVPTRYAVQAGDTLWGVANQNGVSVADLREWNPIENHRRLMPGDMLTIYRDTKQAVAIEAALLTGPPVPVSLAHEGKSSVTHVVREGDTLWGIARQHGISTQMIKDWNRLGDDPIRPGDALKLYLPQDRLVVGNKAG